MPLESAPFEVDVSDLPIGSGAPASSPLELGSHFVGLLAGALTVVRTDHATHEGVHSSVGTHLSVPRKLE